MRAHHLFLVSILSLGVAELATWKFLHPVSFDQTFDKVERDDVLVLPPEINLGDVAIGEHRSIQVKVANRKTRPIQLRQPQSSCGCIRFELDKPLSIGPGETVELSMEYTAPKVPVGISKNILLRVATAEAAWKIPITGRVIAESWASPPKHVVASGERRFGRVHFAEDRQVVDFVVSDPDRIRVTLCPPSANAQSYHVEVVDDGEGEGFVSFFDAAADCLATIPIKWQLPRVLACEPTLVVLNPNPEKKTDKWNVVVLRDPLKTDEPSVAPLVPWVKIASQKVVSEDVLRFSVEVDRGISPGRYDGEIIRVSDRKSGQTAVIKGRI